jgi:acyl-CoA reductase-like NAD-dependent aldehyde dehydrogenase
MFWAGRDGAADLAEISNYLIPQSSIRLITFTGSIRVGKSLAEMAGRHMKPLQLPVSSHVDDKVLTRLGVG